ncbi:ion transporter [Cytophaga hutchinsonii]|uniref:Potassium channel protein n=1 Tax=Cytophaga hutchinsonii (strain ATCC 33406 / DSM 1761 / CIP 103989 / NBRC 15051 / NCIMB 9469 / D465) TaxID=269798 RepID=A0A6N4SU16_CYTH3|nr:ion transporter [Cytophaga hutchinsonii]ABG59892.1 potassium channel protein [Cytophaga hutchinsonii ATCC 33406]SFX27931.1 voltage-gated potassium channel [Cytophaga hutchinsonii ATCC 33406]
MADIKKTVFSILEKDPKTSEFGWIAMIVNFSIVALVFSNIFAVIIQTEKSIATKYDTFFSLLETVSVVFFTIEYLLRVWISNLHKRFSHVVWGRFKYTLTPIAIVDLLAILPFYLNLLFPIDFRFITILRFFRLLRIFKLRRYSQALNTLWKVIVDKKEELVITFVTILGLLIVSASLMYYIERTSQPELFSSIPATMWWSVSTLTTVGYGDIVPITSFGKLLSACIAMLGIAMFALPAALLSSGFTEQIKKQRIKNTIHTCPHCQGKINGKDLFND